MEDSGGLVPVKTLGDLEGTLGVWGKQAPEGPIVSAEERMPWGKADAESAVPVVGVVAPSVERAVPGGFQAQASRGPLEELLCLLPGGLELGFESCISF